MIKISPQTVTWKLFSMQQKKFSNNCGNDACRIALNFFWQLSKLKASWWRHIVCGNIFQFNGLEMKTLLSAKVKLHENVSKRLVKWRDWFKVKWNSSFTKLKLSCLATWKYNFKHTACKLKAEANNEMFIFIIQGIKFKFT